MTLLCVCHCPRHTPQPLDTPLPSAEGPPLAKAPRTLAPPLCEPVTRVPSVRAGLCKPGSKPGSEEAGTRGSRAASAPLVEPRGGRRPPSGAPPREARVARGELTPFFFCVYVYVCVWFFFLAFSVSNSCASEGWWLFQPRALRWVCAVGHGRSVQAANAMAMAPTRTPGTPGCRGPPRHGSHSHGAARASPWCSTPASSSLGVLLSMRWAAQAAGRGRRQRQKQSECLWSLKPHPSQKPLSSLAGGRVPGRVDGAAHPAQAFRGAPKPSHVCLNGAAKGWQRSSPRSGASPCPGPPSRAFGGSRATSSATCLP